MSKMTDKDIIKQKTKAIYPHIVVGGDIDKPCYTIHWYDIEQKTMICGFGSYKLELVRKWLEEEFEVVERDIDNLIKSQETEIKELKKEKYRLQKALNQAEDYLDIAKAEIETLKEAVEIHKGIAEDWKYEAKKLKEMVGEGK